MAGTTTNYGFPYPTSSDLAKNGAAAIQSLAESVDTFVSGSSGVGALFRIYSDSTSTGQTQAGTTFTSKTDCQVSFTTGKSGMFAVILWAAGSNATSGEGYRARVLMSGGSSSATNDLQLRDTANQNGTIVGFFDGTPNTATLATLQIASTSSGSTASVTNAEITVVTFG